VVKETEAKVESYRWKHLPSYQAIIAVDWIMYYSLHRQTHLIEQELVIGGPSW